MALVKTENLSNAIIDGVNEGVFVKNVGGRYVMVNREFAKWAGKPASDIIGKIDIELFEPELANYLSRRIGRC